MKYNGYFYDAISVVYNIIAKNINKNSIRIMFFNEKIKIQKV